MSNYSGVVRDVIGRLAEAFILFLCFLFGRRVRRGDFPWLDGPTGPKLIGPEFHRQMAAASDLQVRGSEDLGLLVDFSALDGNGFDSSRVDPAVRDFYEHTARYHLDVWSQWSPMFWPFGWALMTFVSRRMEQLNFPMYPLETARGMTSEIEQLVDADGRVVYTSWLRRNRGTDRVIYSGFYSTASPPGHGPCVKTVFPVAGGNATVLLRPEVDADGSFRLVSAGRRFGDPGFYRVTDRGGGQLRVWYVRGFTEHFHVYPDPDGSTRTDHYLRWWGLPVLRLHYHITRKASAEVSRQVPEAATPAHRS